MRTNMELTVTLQPDALKILIYLLLLSNVFELNMWTKPKSAFKQPMFSKH